MKRRYVYDRAHDKMVEITESRSFDPVAPLVMPDIKPYQSMIDGREITSRSRHREHLRDHNCVEVGNDSSLYRKPKPLQSPPGLKEKLIRAVQIVKERRR